jgi:Protein of unknown function (DUF1559)
VSGAFQLESKAVRLADITDGLTWTIMAGEKHVPIGYFGQGWLDSSTYNGDYLTCSTRGLPAGVGIAQSIDEIGWMWGSYHPGLCQFVMCDGSLRVLRNDIDPEKLALLVRRDDGMPPPQD